MIVSKCIECNGSRRRYEAINMSIGDVGSCYLCAGTGNNPYGDSRQSPSSGAKDFYINFAVLISLVAAILVGQFVYETLSKSWPYLVSGIVAMFIMYWILNLTSVRRVLELFIFISLISATLYTFYFTFKIIMKA